MRIALKQGLLVSLLALSVGMISCDERKERVFDNPNDINGVSWTPPSVEMLTRTVVVGMGDTTILRAVVSDPDPQDRVVVMRAFVPGLLDDSASIPSDIKDTVSRATVFSEPGRVYKVYVWVHDNKGVWCVRPDSALVDVHRYAPVASMKALSDSVEPGDTVKYAVSWTDTAGKVVRYIWQRGTKVDTTKDSIHSFVAGGVGQDVVVAWAVDDDGNLSQAVTANTVVRTLNPWIVSLQANKDTAEANKDVVFTMRGDDRKPGRVAKYVWMHRGRTDTTSDSVRTIKVGDVGTYEIKGVVLDDDGYPSPAKTLTIPVVTYPPGASEFKALSDTAELGKTIKFSLKGSDRAPGRIVKWLVGHEGRIDTVKAPNATKSLTDTSISISFAYLGLGIASAYAVDEDGLVSGVLLDTVVVTRFPPKTTYVRSLSDTVEAGKPFKVMVRGTDRAPGRIAKWLVYHEGKTDTSTKDSVVEIVAQKTTGLQVVAGYVMDDDGNNTAWLVDTVVVTNHVPAATYVKVDDTLELNKQAKCVLKGADRSPGRIVKWRVTYAGRTDSLVLSGTSKSLVDTFLYITPANPGGWTVTAVAVDDDDNASPGIKDTFHVATYPPTATSLVATADSVEVGNALRFKLSGADRSPGSIRKWIFVHDGENDTVAVDTMSLTPSQVGIYVVGGIVVDNDGYSSAIIRDTVKVVRYVPTVVSLKAASDTGEVGKPMKFTLKASDRSPGRIAKWVFVSPGRTDTIKADLSKSVTDTSISLTPAASGSYTVSAYVIDNDGNVSTTATAGIVVTSYIPGIVSLSTVPDTAEVGKSFKVVLKAIDRSPGKIAKWVFMLPGKTDTINADLSRSVTDTSIVAKAGATGAYTITAAVVDNDGNVSATKSISVTVVVHRPVANMKGPDSAEINRPVGFTISAKDRSPGKVVKYAWSYAGKIDTTLDSARTFQQAVAGAMTVSGWAIDDDSNMSDRAEITVDVKAHAPVLASLPATTLEVALGDTARIVPVATDAPTDPSGDSLVFKWNTDDGRSGIVFSKGTIKIVDTLEKTIVVEVTAWDKDSLVSATQTMNVRFLPRKATILSPGNRLLLADTMVTVQWRDGLYRDSFRVLIDTLPIASASQNVAKRIKALASELTASVPKWNRSWYVRTLSFRGGDSVLSDEVAFSTPEDVKWRSTLANLEVATDTWMNSPVALDSAFRPDDTVYRIHLPEGVTNIFVQGTGTLTTGDDKQIIEIGGTQEVGILKYGVGIVTVPAMVAVKVYSPNANVVRTYRIHVTRETSPYVKLQTLSLGTGYNLTPSFHPDTSNYVVSIPAGESTPITWTGNSLASVSFSHGNGSAEAEVRGSWEDTAGVLLTVSRTGVANNYYRIKVRILPSRETRLNNLQANYYPWEYFSVDSSSFLRNFPEGTTEASFIPSLREGQTMLIDGASAASGVAKSLTLVPGMNTHTIKVVAADGVSSRTYTLLLYRQPSTNNNLSNLELLHGAINFYYEYQNYDVTLPYEQDHIALRATPAAANNGGMRFFRIGKSKTDTFALASGVWSDSSYLAVNDTVTLRVQVKAEDTTSKRVYDVRFTRAMPDTFRQLASLSLSSTQNLLSVPDGFSDQFDTVLQANVPFADSLFLVSASWYESWKIRSVKVDAKALANDIYTRDTVVVKANDTTEIPVVVTAQDSTKSRTYLVKVFRSAPSSNADLYYLYARTPRGTIWQGTPPDSFALTVPYEDSVADFHPYSADNWARRITVEGNVTATQTWSVPIRLTKVADTNRVVIEVTAQDTTVKRTYVVRILRQAAHTDASLSNLVLTSMAGGLALSPSFSGADTMYTASTLYLDSSLTVKPTWSDGLATRIRVNGTEVASGASSGAIALPVGDSTTITVEVTAQDTTVKRTYWVKVYRNRKSTNALLAGFGENVGTLSPMVNAADTVHSLNVASTVSSVTLAPTVADAYASFTVNGSASTRLIALGAAGTTTTATLVVTAQDPTKTRTYTLNIVRERDADTIGGQILADRTLELAGSPYVVEAALVVNPGVTLTIKPGVRLKFKTGIGMSIQGTLIAEGTAAQPIVFTRAESSKWGILDFDETAVSASYNADGTYASGSILKHCVFEYGGNASNVDNAANLYLKKAFPHIDSTTIRYSSSQGIYGTGIGEVRWNGLQVVGCASNGVNMTVNKFFLRRSAISGNGRGMVVTPTASFVFPEEWLVIDTSSFLNNSVSGHAGGLYIGLGDSKENLKTILRGNRFEGNVSTDRAGALYYEPGWACGGNTIALEGNTFKNNHTSGEGGAMVIRQYYGGLGISSAGNLFEDNYATRIGAVDLRTDYSNQGSSYYDSANVYRNNRSTGADGYAGALWVSNDYLSVRIVHSRFEGNSVPNSTSGTGALDLTRISGTAEVLNNVFKGNSGNGRGAAIFCRATNLVGNLFQSNSSQTLVGAVQWTEDAAGTITDNTFYGNSAARVGGKTIATNSIVMQIDGFPAVTGNNFLQNSTDRILRTDNTLGQANIDAKDNWWNSASPFTYKIIVDKYANLDDASSLAAFTVNPVLIAPNPSAPATE